MSFLQVKVLVSTFPEYSSTLSNTGCMFCLHTLAKVVAGRGVTRAAGLVQQLMSYHLITNLIVDDEKSYNLTFK